MGMYAPIDEPYTGEQSEKREAFLNAAIDLHEIAIRYAAVAAQVLKLAVNGKSAMTMADHSQKLHDNLDDFGPCFKVFCEAQDAILFDKETA